MTLINFFTSIKEIFLVNVRHEKMMYVIRICIQLVLPVPTSVHLLIGRALSVLNCTCKYAPFAKWDADFNAEAKEWAFLIGCGFTITS